MFFHLNLEPETGIYLIRRKDFIDPRFFLQDCDFQSFAFDYVRWTAFKVRANAFKTEEAVETFKADFLQRYSCEIIRV